MDALHTPGPLRALQSRATGDVAVLNKEGSFNYVVAECFADIRRNGEQAREEALANAKLYAAAPDMLAVLKQVDKLLPIGFLEFRAEISAAIAKAEG